MRATNRIHRAAAVLGVLAGTLLWGHACLAQPAGTKILVSDVVIQGNRLVSTQQIASGIKTRAGQPYSESTLQEDVRNLMATRQYGNVETRTLPDGEGRIRVYFLITDFPNTVLNVEYRGRKHLSLDDLEKTTGIRKGQAMNPVANKLACQAIVRKLNEQGRVFADCVLLAGDKPGDTEVIFQITEGHKVKVRDIDFVGNTFVSGPVLAQRIVSGKQHLGLFGGDYEPAKADADVAKLIEYYRNFGYMDIRVGYERQFDPDGKSLVLVFHVEEGVRYRVQGDPKILNVHSVPTEALNAFLETKNGEYVSAAHLKTDEQHISDYIGYNGIKAAVREEFVYSPEHPGEVQTQIVVEEERVARVGRVYVVGNSRTKQDIILNQVPLYPGQILTYPDIRQAEKNLAKLGIFKSTPDGSVRPSVTILNPDMDGEFKDLLVTVEEDNTGSLLFGVGVNSDAGLTGSIVLNERNFDITRFPTSFEDLISGNAFRGAGQEMRIEAVPGTTLQRYSVSFREPFLFSTPNSLSVSAYYFDRQYDEYTETREGMRVTLGRKFAEHWTASVGVRIENISVHDLAIGVPVDYTSVQGDNFAIGPQVGLTYDTRDSVLRPTEGTLVSASYEQVFGDHTYPLLNLEANQFFTVYQRADGSGRHVVALRSQVSWAGDNTPVYDRYFAGGFRSLRGFAFRGVSPESPNGYRIGGDFMFLNSVEYQIPVLANDSFYFVSFVDSGTVEPRTEIRDYRVSAGFGVRFMVPMLGPVPIALDFAFPIVKGPRDQEQVFSFWLGFFR
jgi:outer membrane protein assembly factor BamA